MKRGLIILILLLLCVGIATAEEVCITIEACIDGTDWVKVENSQLSIEHGTWDPMGSRDNCPSTHWEILYFNSRPLPLQYEPQINGPDYKIDFGDYYYPMNFVSLNRFEKNSGQGEVSIQGNEIFIDDDDHPGGSVYNILLCGDPPVSTPEFPSAFLPVTMIIGFLGAVLLIQRTREH